MQISEDCSINPNQGFLNRLFHWRLPVCWICVYNIILGLTPQEKTYQNKYLMKIVMTIMMWEDLFEQKTTF